MQVDANSLGSYLRRERELRQVSLQDISAATKVQRKFLEALEHDDYDQLPPAPFVVGFLRAYAQCLALHPEDIVAAYHARHMSSEDLDGQQLFVAYQVKRSQRLSRAGIGFILILILLVAGGVWRTLWWGREAGMTTVSSRGGAVERMTTDAKPEPDPVPTASEPSQGIAEPATTDAKAESDAVPPAAEMSPTQPAEPTPVASQVSTVLSLPVEQEPPVAAAVTSEILSSSSSGVVPPESPAEPEPPAAPPASLVLQAVALEDTWLRVDIDGDTRHALLLTAGNSIRWEATTRFVLTVGNAQGTRLMLNGQDVSLPPTRSNVVRDFVLARDVVN